MQKAIGITKKSKTKTKLKKILLPTLMGIFIFLILVSVGTLVYMESFRDKVYPGVKVASFDVGGYTSDQTKDVIEKRIEKLNNIGLVFTGTNEGEDSISYEDLGISFDVDKTYEDTYNYGRNKVSDVSNVKDVYSALFKGKDVPIVIDYDEEKFESKINELASDKIQDSKDAEMSVEDGEIVISSEENGVGVDFDSLKQEIEKLASSDNIYKKIAINTSEEPANISVADIEGVEDDVQSYLDKKVVYKNNYVEYVPTDEDMIKWIKVEKHSDPKATISDDGIREYISSLASKIDKKRVDTKVNAETGEVISEGTDGVVLDQEKALIDTKSALNSDKDESLITLKTKIDEKQEVKVQPQTKTSGGTPGLADGKYIEVNLSTQTLYLFDGDNEQGAYSVSTGKWDMPTPIGTRTISGKSDRAWSAKYGLYMPYWMDIGGGYGIHELPEWPNGYKEGESHLGTPVSHGCIRLGVGAAASVYGWAPIGTQVFIHQ